MTASLVLLVIGGVFLALAFLSWGLRLMTPPTETNFSEGVTYSTPDKWVG